MPIYAEPVILPKIEIGHPMGNKKCCNNGLGIEDLLALFSQLNQPEPQIIYQPPPQYPVQPPPARTPKKKKRIFEDMNKKVKIPENPKKEEPKKNGLKRDW